VYTVKSEYKYAMAKRHRVVPGDLWSKEFGEKRNQYRPYVPLLCEGGGIN